MIQIISAANAAAHPELLEKAFRLRHEIFVEEMNWREIARPDRREIDEFDDDQAVHLLAVHDDEVVGYSRLLPTTRPYVISTHLPHLCEGLPPSAPSIWEWSRVGVAASVRTSGRRLNPTALEILTGIVEWGLPRGVRGFVSAQPTSWVLRLLQLQIHALPLGLPHTIDGAEIVAVHGGFDGRSLAQLRAMRGDASSVLAPDSQPCIRLVN